MAPRGSELEVDSRPHVHPSAGVSWRLFFGAWVILAFFLNPIPYSKAKGHIASTRIWLETGSFVMTGPADWGSEHERSHDTEFADELGEYAVHEGRIYPKYPPGTNVLLAPLHVMAQPLAQRFGPALGILPNERTDAVIVNCLGAVFLSAASVALCGVLVWWSAGQLACSEPARLAAAGLTVFGTLLFYHGTGLYTKPISSMLGFAAMTLIWAQRDRANSRLAIALAGFIAGFAVTVDYQAGITMLCILGYAAIVLPWQRAATVAIFAAIPIAGLLAFHWQVLGHPLLTTYSYSLGHRTGFGLERLRWEPLVGLTVGFSRGIVWYMPAVILGGAGLARSLFRNAPHRIEALVCAAIVAGHFLFNLAATAWTSGPGYGPRYLVLAIPFVMMWFPESLRTVPRWCVWSVSIMSVAVSYLGAQAYFVPDNESIPLRAAWQTFWASGGASTRMWRWIAMRAAGDQWQGADGLADPSFWTVTLCHTLSLALIAAWIWLVTRGLRRFARD